MITVQDDKHINELEGPLSTSEEGIQKLQEQVTDPPSERSQTTSTHDDQREALEERVERLEQALRASDEDRQRLHEQAIGLRDNWSETLARYETLRENRNKESEKHAERLQERDEEADRLRARIKILEKDIAATQRHRLTRSPSSFQGADAGELERLQRRCAKSARREAELVDDLRLERERSQRLERQLLDEMPHRGSAQQENDEDTEPTQELQGQQQRLQHRVRDLTDELLKTREALADSQKSYWDARFEISRLNHGRSSSAAQFMRQHEHLLDPQSTLYENMMAMAAYQDGEGPAPSSEQRADCRLFRDYLADRTQTLQSAMSLNDPRPALDAFDDKWAAAAATRDWGVTIALRLSATRAATSIKFADAGRQGTEDLEALISSITRTRARLGGGDSTSIGEKVIDLYDELQKIKHPKARA